MRGLWTINHGGALPLSYSGFGGKIRRQWHERTKQCPYLGVIVMQRGASCFRRRPWYPYFMIVRDHPDGWDPEGQWPGVPEEPKEPGVEFRRFILEVRGRLRPFLLQIMERFPYGYEEKECKDELEAVLMSLAPPCAVPEMERVRAERELDKIILRLNERLLRPLPDSHNATVALIGIDGDPEAWEECRETFARGNRQHAAALVHSYADREDAFYKICHGILAKNPRVYFLDQSNTSSDAAPEQHRLFQDACVIAVDGSSRDESFREILLECVRLRREFYEKAEQEWHLPWNRRTHLRFAIGSNWYRTLRNLQLTWRSEITVMPEDLLNISRNMISICLALGVRFGPDGQREEWQPQ